MYLESVHILSSERWIFTRRHPFKLHPGEEVEHHLHLCCLPITTSSPPSVLTFNTSFNFVCFCTWCKWNVDSMSGVFSLSILFSSIHVAAPLVVHTVSLPCSVPFCCRWTWGLSLIWDYYKYFCCEHPRTRHQCLCTHLCGVYTRELEAESGHAYVYL